MFGLGWMGVIFAATLVIALLAMATGSQQVAAAVLMPVGLLITAMFSTSLYFTFRDSFVGDPLPEQPVATDAP